jgi:DNA polymerase I
MSQARVYLVDASIYVFRAWHVYDGERFIDSDGNPRNAVFGFCEFLQQLTQLKRPQYLACAFDASQTNSYRKALYPAYKANREPAPEELRQQFALCRQFCRAVGIPEYGSDRYEADDLIGTLAARLRNTGFAITVISADKDLTQLVIGDNDHWWDFARGTVLDRHGVRRLWGVHPEQIADMLAIAGDKVDNIPGIPGIGYKLAAKVLQKYPCIDSIIDNLDSIASMKFRGAARVQALLRAHQGLLPLNRQLTAIVTDVNCNIDNNLSWQFVENEGFEEFMATMPGGDYLRQRWLALSDEHQEST